MTDPVVWPFHNGVDYAERLEWSTMVDVAATGPSYHRRMRSDPRTFVSFSSMQEGAAWRRLESMLRANVAGRWMLPIHVESRKVAGSFPVVEAQLTGPPDVSRITGSSCEYSVEFILVESFAEEAPAAVESYRSFPVFDACPQWTASPKWSPERLVQGVDYGIARPFTYDLAGMNVGKRTMFYSLESDAEIIRFRQMLYALAGRWSPCWVPSWAEDFRVVANVANGATTLDVAGPQLAGLDLVPNHRDIRIELHNGTVLYRRIESVATPSAGVERLTLDSAIATEFSASDVAQVSWMALCVQDSDINLLRYWTHEVMECELTWRELAHAL